MNHESAHIEMREMETIDRIDPEGLFHVMGPIQCDLDLEDPDTIEDVAKCRELLTKIDFIANFKIMFIFS